MLPHGAQITEQLGRYLPFGMGEHTVFPVVDRLIAAEVGGGQYTVKSCAGAPDGAHAVAKLHRLLQFSVIALTPQVVIQRYNRTTGEGNRLGSQPLGDVVEIMRKTECQVVIRVQAELPAHLLKIITGIQVVGWVSIAIQLADGTVTGAVAELYIHAIITSGHQRQPSIDESGLLGVHLADGGRRGEPVITPSDCSEPPGGAASLATVTSHEAVDAIVADLQVGGAALLILRLAGNDIDDAEERVRAVSRGIRSTHHFDALDVFDGDRQCGPVHLTEDRRIHATAVNEYLHAARVAITKDKVRRAGDAAVMGHNHARHQPQQVEDIARPGGLDFLTVYDRHRHGRLIHALADARSGEHYRQVLKVGLLGQLRLTGTRGERRGADSRQRQCQQCSRDVFPHGRACSLSGRLWCGFLLRRSKVSTLQGRFATLQAPPTQGAA